MASPKPRAILERAYEEAAQAYLRSLPLEHFAEAFRQGRQREITLSSLDIVKVSRPDLQLFNELLVQYPAADERTIRQVVPDNMVVLSEKPIKAVSSFNLPLEPVAPFLVLDYLSKHSKRKDYKDNFEKYERELKVPYVLQFDTDTPDLNLCRHTGRDYVAVKPNEHGRCTIPELELEVGLLDGWVRYWFRGELVPRLADLVREVEAARREAVEITRLVEKEKRRADEATRRANEATRRADEARQRRLAAEQELARLQAEREQMPVRQREGTE